jgi:2-(1,2-epoxy-1,2-dihydrophenyl)acetyl-CoA isomerase
VTEHVLGAVQDGIGTITLNRPERKNALTPQMLDRFVALLEEMELREDVRVIVLAGAGDAFCAGADVAGFDPAAAPERPRPTGADVIRLHQERQRGSIARIFRTPKPVVASLSGPAVGVGMGLALAADLRIGGPHAMMRTAFAGVGLSGDSGVAWFLTRLVGHARARELLYLNPRVDAQRCLELGLIHRLVGDDLLEQTTGLALELAAGPPFAIARMKLNVESAISLDLEDAMDLEVVRHASCKETGDHTEAVSAFLERRRPVFGGVFKTRTTRV